MGVTDSISLVINLLSDVVQDSVGAADAAVKSVSATHAETPAVSDVKILAASLNKADTAGATDAGTYRGQGYCDYLFSSDDYVGYAGTL